MEIKRDLIDEDIRYSDILDCNLTYLEQKREFYNNCARNFSSMVKERVAFSEVPKLCEYPIMYEHYEPQTEENEIQDICNNVYLSIREINPNISYEETKIKVIQCLSKMRQKVL